MAGVWPALWFAALGVPPLALVAGFAAKRDWAGIAVVVLAAVAAGTAAIAWAALAPEPPPGGEAQPPFATRLIYTASVTFAVLDVLSILGLRRVATRGRARREPGRG